MYLNVFKYSFSLFSFLSRLHLVYTWFTPGLHLAAPGLHLVYTWQHLVYTWFTPGSTWSTPGLHLVYTWQHLVYTWFYTRTNTNPSVNDGLTAHRRFVYVVMTKLLLAWGLTSVDHGSPNLYQWSYGWRKQLLTPTSPVRLLNRRVSRGPFQQGSESSYCTQSELLMAQTFH